MASVLKIHSIRGDDEFHWDPAVDDERRRTAEDNFKSAKSRDYFAYSRLENGDTEVISEFKPNAREILMTVPLNGG